MDIQSLLIFVTLFCVHSTLMDGCGNLGAGGAFSLTVMSRRNSTGHRRVTAEANIPERIRKFGAFPDTMALDVAQKACGVNGERNIRLVASLVVSEPRVPPPGYDLLSGLGWYRLHLKPLTWEEARLACEAEGAHLAVLNSPEEAAALKWVFNKAPKSIPNATYSNLAFIGYSDMAVEGKYVTIFGESLTEAGYETWEAGQPNNISSDTDPDQDCGGFDRASGKLNDLQCRGRIPFFCEQSL